MCEKDNEAHLTTLMTTCTDSQISDVRGVTPVSEKEGLETTCVPSRVNSVMCLRV